MICHVDQKRNLTTIKTLTVFKSKLRVKIPPRIETQLTYAPAQIYRSTANNIVAMTQIDAQSSKYMHTVSCSTFKFLELIFELRLAIKTWISEINKELSLDKPT